jgi:hypothetical protein
MDQLYLEGTTVPYQIATHQEINKNLTGLIAVWYLIPVLEYILQSLTVL